MKLITILIFFIGFLLSSCGPVNPPTTPVKGPLPLTKIIDNKGIPSKFGELKFITTHGQYQGWVQLWFVDDEDTVRMVALQFQEQRIHENVLVIPRY